MNRDICGVGESAPGLSSGPYGVHMYSLLKYDTTYNIVPVVSSATDTRRCKFGRAFCEEAAGQR